MDYNNALEGIDDSRAAIESNKKRGWFWNLFAGCNPAHELEV